MVFAAVIFMILGVTLVILSQLRDGQTSGLPPREVRRVWLPFGLVLVTLSVLFGITYSTTLPSSPLRQAETQQVLTRHANATMGMHTQYFIAHTSTTDFGTIQALQSQTNPITLTASGITGFEMTATVLILNATATQFKAKLETVAAADFIAQTGTANAQQSTATPVPTATSTPR